MMGTRPALKGFSRMAKFHPLHAAVTRLPVVFLQSQQGER